MSRIVQLKGRIYQSIAGFESHLALELNEAEIFGHFYHSETISAFWAQNIWIEPFLAEFDSISEAAGILRDIQRNWAGSLFTCFRRGALIKEKLPPVSEKKRVFPWFPPDSSIGAWTLTNEHTLIASAHCSSPFPNGIIAFEENKTEPPSRAYLKLWEAFSLCGKTPTAGKRCLDAGASPGSWTWALAKLGVDVTAIDRAPLDEKLLALPNVHFLKHDAFTLKPEDIGRTDWLFCDVICYPSRLYEWIEKWLVSGLCRNFICTIKMQGKTPDFEITRRFADIPESYVVHLCHNKHELTWIYQTAD